MEVVAETERLTEMKSESWSYRDDWYKTTV